jgi:hypothetical protein
MNIINKIIGARKVETECLECGERNSHLNVVRNSLRYHTTNGHLELMTDLEGDTLVIKDICTFCNGAENWERERRRDEPRDPDEPIPF